MRRARRVMTLWRGMRERRWQMKYGLGIRIIPSQKLAFLQYEFYDSKRQFIDMQEEHEVAS